MYIFFLEEFTKENRVQRERAQAINLFTHHELIETYRFNKQSILFILDLIKHEIKKRHRSIKRTPS